MIKIIGRSYLKDHWIRHPETEDVLKAWFYRFQNTAYKDAGKIIENPYKTRALNLKLTPYFFLLADFHEDLEVLRIRDIETFCKDGSSV